MSIGPLTKKLLQKHRLVSYSKNEENVHFPLTESATENEENVHFPHGPLLKTPQRASSPGLMHIEAACAC